MPIFRDAKLMANDVDKALTEIVSEKGQMDVAKAQEYLKRSDSPHTFIVLSLLLVRSKLQSQMFLLQSGGH